MAIYFSSALKKVINPEDVQNAGLSLQDEQVLIPEYVADKDPDVITEPMCDTVVAQFKAILSKLRYVLFPFNTDKKKRKKSVRDWDLWGPLLFCLTLSILISSLSSSSSPTLIFQLTFIIIWAGAAIIAINGRLLGGKISLFQAVCTLGYCLFPLVISAILILMIGIGFSAFWLSVLITALGYLWCCYSAYLFLGEMVPQDRISLALYPVVLFYLYLGWLMVS